MKEKARVNWSMRILTSRIPQAHLLRLNAVVLNKESQDFHVDVEYIGRSPFKAYYGFSRLVLIGTQAMRGSG